MRNEETEKQEVLDHRRTELLAHEFWHARGCPEGTAEQDWYLAEEQLRHQQARSPQDYLSIVRAA